MNEKAVRICYTNWRGETAYRNIVPGRIRWGSNEWHPGPQWLMDAYDLDKKASRTFAMEDVLEWKGAT